MRESRKHPKWCFITPVFLQALCVAEVVYFQEGASVMAAGGGQVSFSSLPSLSVPLLILPDVLRSLFCPL